MRLPATSAVVVNVAWPEAFNGAVPRGIDALTKTTWPVGVPGEVEVTVAVNVTD